MASPIDSRNYEISPGISQPRASSTSARGLDVCSRKIVGYAIGPRITSQLADAALRTAIAKRRPTGTVVVHSDRGGQFRSRRYQRTLRAHGLIGSMGRVSSAFEAIIGYNRPTQAA